MVKLYFLVPNFILFSFQSKFNPKNDKPISQMRVNDRSPYSIHICIFKKFFIHASKFKVLIDISVYSRKSN